jgi:hypothetical protein
MRVLLFYSVTIFALLFPMGVTQAATPLTFPMVLEGHVQNRPVVMYLTSLTNTYLQAFYYYLDDTRSTTKGREYYIRGKRNGTDITLSQTNFNNLVHDRDTGKPLRSDPVKW